MKTSICHISDNHGKPLSPLRDKGLLILSGDITPNDTNNFTPGIKLGESFTPTGWWQWNYRLIDKKEEALQQRVWLNRQLDQLKNIGYDKSNIIFCPGNHDFDDCTDILPHSCWQTPKTITVKGVKIGLLPGVKPVTGEWNDEIPEYEIKQRILQLDPDIDVLVSHSAPYGILDTNYGAQHTGSEEIYTAIMGGAFGQTPPYFTKIKLHCFGHSHEGRGCDEYEVNGRKIKFSNAAQGRHELAVKVDYDLSGYMDGDPDE